MSSPHPSPSQAQPINQWYHAAAPQASSHITEQWARQQALERECKARRLRSMETLDPVAEKVVTLMHPSYFGLVRPTPQQAPASSIPNPEHGSLFAGGTPLEDLGFNLRGFLAINPVEDPNALYARISVKQGHASPGDLPPLPESVSELINGHAALHSPQPYANQWVCQQNLEQQHEALQLRSQKMIDPVAERAVTDMDISCFVGPTPEVPDYTFSPTHENGGSLFPAGAQPEDLDFSLRGFLAVDPTGGPDALYARIAVKEGRAIPGDFAPLPPRKEIEWSCKACKGLD